MIADEAIAMAEHEREAEGVEEHSAKTCVHNALHQHVHGFARAAESSFQHGETDLHAKHQECSHQRPDGVDRINHIRGFDPRISGVNVTKEHPGDDDDDEQDQTNTHCFAGKKELAVSTPLRVAQPDPQPGKFLRYR